MENRRRLNESVLPLAIAVIRTAIPIFLRTARDAESCCPRLHGSTREATPLGQRLGLAGRIAPGFAWIPYAAHIHSTAYLA